MMLSAKLPRTHLRISRSQQRARRKRNIAIPKSMKAIPANQSSRNSPRLRQPYTHAQRGHFTSLDLTRGQPRSRIHGQSTIRQFSRPVSVGCPVIGRAQGRTPLFPALRPCLAGFTHQSSQSSMWRCKPTHSSPPTLESLAEPRSVQRRRTTYYCRDVEITSSPVTSIFVTESYEPQ